MKSKMPKLAYRLIFGLLLMAFTFTACNNKKKKTEKATTTDTTVQKPTSPGDPVDGGN